MPKTPGRLYEFTIHKCQECPECQRHQRLVELNYCDITGKQIPDIKKIPKWCPLQETKG